MKTNNYARLHFPVLPVFISAVRYFKHSDAKKVLSKREFKIEKGKLWISREVGQKYFEAPNKGEWIIKDLDTGQVAILSPLIFAMLYQGVRIWKEGGKRMFSNV